MSATLSFPGSSVLVAVLTLAAATTLGRSTRVCTPAPVPLGRSSDDVFFIGTALPDTLLAGAGNRDWATGQGHSGYGRSRKIYGQVVQIEQLRGLSATRLPAATKRVVLVPWDYGADCSTVVWGRSARWIAREGSTVFSAHLRPRDQWANDLPTLDVSSPEFSLYPFDTRRLYMLVDTTMNDLPIDAVLDLYERLPLDRDLSESPDLAIQPLESWVQSNPTLARRQPARTILSLVRTDAEERRVSLMRSPIVGTYRFVITAPDYSQVLYARTEGRPWSSLRSDNESRSPPDSLIGYYVMTAWRKSIRDLPRTFGEDDDTSPNIAITLTPLFETPDSAVWHGQAAALDQGFWNRATGPYHALILQTPEDWRYLPGFWTTYRDGSVRYRRAFPPDGAPIVTVVGQRISNEVMSRDTTAWR